MQLKGFTMKVFSANVTGGQVLIEGKPVTGCEILGLGGDSYGAVVFAEDKLVYIPNTSPDIDKLIDVNKDLLQFLNDLILLISNEIYASNGGGEITAPTFKADMLKKIQDLTIIQQDFGDLQKDLK